MNVIPSHPKNNKDWIGLLCWISLIFCWGSLFSRVSLWWNEASYYTHGYSVPFLALVLCFRLRDESTTNISHKKSEAYFFVSFIFLYFFSRIIVEPDPFWRLPLWIETLTLSVCSVLLIRNSKIPLSVRSLSLVALYLLTCLPWPARLESLIVLSLSNQIGYITGELLLLLGYPAEVMGSLIRVDQTEISINNACSGIRSLQNLISFAIFFSIYFRHPLFLFCLSLFCACGITFFFNSLRALSLSLVSLEMGNEIQQEWHDLIGNIFICGAFLSLFFLTWFFKNSQVFESNENQFNRSKWNARLPKSFSMMFIWAFLLIEGTVYGWFSIYLGSKKEFGWYVEPTKSSTPIDEGVQEVLQFDYGHQQRVTLANDQTAEVIFFGYHENSAAASLCSRNHPPDYCMAHTGISLIESSAPTVYKIGNEVLTFRHYQADRNSLTHLVTHVFWCSATVDSRISEFEFEQTTLIEKLLRFLTGKLSYKRQVILVSITGRYTERKAQSELFKVLQRIINSK